MVTVDYCLVRCVAICCGREVRLFRRNLLHLQVVFSEFVLGTCPEDRRSRFLYYLLQFLPPVMSIGFRSFSMYSCPCA
jgi:hypothetical protein